MKLGMENSGLNNTHIKYLREKLKQLEEKEKYVTLMLDEIYVKSCISYKGGKIEGVNVQRSEDQPLTAASTIQTFMIRSVLSHNKDVVGLFPVSKLKSEFLLELTNKILKLLTEAGYQVMCIVSDNNSVNRKMFEMLCGGTLKHYILNPYNIEQKVFILFDVVHLLKVLRNNWLNQKDINQTFVIPQISENFAEGDTEIDNTTKAFVCVAYLKKLYQDEVDEMIKLAPSLNRKVLYPTSIERQNVSLCLRLFDEKNIAALKIKNSNTCRRNCKIFEVDCRLVENCQL